MSDPPLPLPASQSGPRSSLERLRRALETAGYSVRLPRSSELMSRCPVHEERTGSLHATWKAGHGGGGFTVVYCHGCHAGGPQICDALGIQLADLFDEPLPERDRTNPRVGPSPARRLAGQRRGRLGRLPALLQINPSPQEDDNHDWQVVVTYPYTDVGGQLVEEVVREECACDGARHKRFRQIFVLSDGRRVRRKPADFTPVLYHAAEVAAAVRNGQPLWLVEGEKDADRLRGLTEIATTNAQGGASFPDELLDALAGAHVIVALDRDATGWARGADLHAKLTALDSTVELKLPAVTTPKADISDHLDAGFTLEQMIDVRPEEVATWATYATAAEKARSVAQAIDQARARRALADQGESVEDNQRFGTRWVLESQIRQEVLREVVERVHAQGIQCGTPWVAEAMELADALLTERTEDARRLHHELGVAVPESLRPKRQPSEEANAAPPVDPPAAGAAAASTSEDPWSGSGTRASAPVFRIMNRQIVQWEPNRGGRRSSGSDEDEDGGFKCLLSMVVKLTVREYLEVAGDQDDLARPVLMGRSEARKPVAPPRSLIAVRLEYPDPVTGELMEIRVMADQWRDHSWIDSLPGAPDYDHKRAGLDQLQRAIVAVSDQVVDQVLYRSTGWRERPDGGTEFVHRRGAISAEGHRPGEVALSGPLERYDWPDPVTDPAVIREAWLQGGLSMIDRVPARVMVPLIGAAFRAVLGHNPWVVALIGPPGSYKTSLAAKVMHFFGEQWEHSKPASSMSGNGDTLNAIRYKLHNAKDTLYWMDDFAPTKSWLDAQKLLEETARVIHNAEERSRSSRDGLSISDGTGPRASGLFTSEVMPRPGSASERMLVVPLSREDIDTTRLFPLDEPESRHQRAVVMSSFISWLARDLRGRRKVYDQLAADYAVHLADEGETVRQAAALAAVWVGWVAVTDYLIDIAAITDTERHDTLTRAHAAITAAGRAAVDPDMPRTTGARVAELLGYALRQGIAYVDDVRTGDCPPWPLARQLGWRRSVPDPHGVPGGERVRIDRLGIPLGYVCHDPGAKERGRVIMCESTQLEAVLRAASSTQAERLEIDRNTACRALAEEGVLLVDSSEGRTRHTLKCVLYAEESAVRRMVTLRLDPIIGTDPVDPDDDLEPDGGGPGSGPNPARVPPGLGPHSVDGVGAAEQDDEVSAAGCEVAEPELPEEDNMAEPTDWVDLDGVVGWTDRARPERGPCVICGQMCVMSMDGGLRIHPVCWRASSAADRAAARRPAPAPAPVARPAQAPSSGARPAAEVGFRAAGAVADVAGLWLPDGELCGWPAEPKHVGHLVMMAQRIGLGSQVTRYLSAAGQVWVTARLLAQMGVDPGPIVSAENRERDAAAKEATRGSALVDDAIDAGYRLGQEGDCLGRWTRVWKGTEKATWIVLLPAMPTGDASTTDSPLTGDEPDPQTLARRIGRLADALGQPFAMNPGTTGLDLLKALRWKDRETFFVARPAVDPAGRSVEADIVWSRKPAEDEVQQTWVHAYDRGGSYLAGVSGLEVPVGEAVHHPEGCVFNPRLPGYWKIEIPEAWDWRMPNGLDPLGKSWGKVRWVTTPSLAFAFEQGVQPEIVEAFTWPQHARIFDPWYERIRDARTALDTPDPDDQVARDQLKLIYAATIGMLGSKIHMEGRDMYAPERRHHIVAKARTNILRRVAAIGAETDRWPVAIAADTVIYTSDEADPVKAWPGGEKWLGRGLGQYKPEGSARLADHLRWLTGDGYQGKDALVKRMPGAE